MRASGRGFAPPASNTTTQQKDNSWLDFLDLSAATKKLGIYDDSNCSRAAAMTESAAPGVSKSNGSNGTNGDTTSSSAAGIPFYEKQRQHLKELIGRRRALEKKLVGFPPAQYPARPGLRPPPPPKKKTKR